MLTFAQAAPDPTGGWVSIIQNISGWVALVALILSGFVVLKPFYVEMRQERNLLRDALDKERERNTVLQHGMETVIEQNKTVIHVLESIRDGARKAP